DPLRLWTDGRPLDNGDERVRAVRQPCHVCGEGAGSCCIVSHSENRGQGMASVLFHAVGTALGALMLVAPQQAVAARPLENESFRIGSQGALCEAHGVMLGASRATLFDRKWALICADVDRPIGAAYSWSGAGEAASYLGRGRDEILDCAEAGASPIGPAIALRRCRDKATGLEWNSYTAASGERIHIV